MVKEGSLNNHDELQIMTTLSWTRRKLTNKEFEFFLLSVQQFDW